MDQESAFVKDTQRTRLYREVVASDARRPRTAPQVPRWLADRHRELAVGDLVDVEPETVDVVRRARRGPAWSALVEGAGFELAGPHRLRRLDSLPDFIGPAMRVLVIGLNPSPAAAAAGIGFARPGNRFWPAALAGGLVSRDRQPIHALDHHGVGFSDIVKRTTRRADDLSRQEFEAGIGRLHGLCRWLRPDSCLMIGLAGWRAAVDRRSVAGWQDIDLGGRPVYLMPSTSGLNAASSLDELTEHLATVAAATVGASVSSAARSAPDDPAVDRTDEQPRISGHD